MYGILFRASGDNIKIDKFPVQAITHGKHAGGETTTSPSTRSQVCYRGFCPQPHHALSFLWNGPTFRYKGSLFASSHVADSNPRSMPAKKGHRMQPRGSCAHVVHQGLQPVLRLKFLNGSSQTIAVQSLKKQKTTDWHVD